MSVRIDLRLAGIDLREPDSYEQVDDALDDLFFSATGPISTATLMTNSDNPIAEAVDAARRITKLIHGVTIPRAHRELVTVADIAARCDVSVEAVRLWAQSKRRSTLTAFPAVEGMVGGDSGRRPTSVWSWPAVLAWVRDVVQIDPEEGFTYLSPSQTAQLDVDLARANELADASSWTMTEVAREMHVSAAPHRGLFGSSVPSIHLLDVSALDGLINGQERVEAKRCVSARSRAVRS